MIAAKRTRHRRRRPTTRRSKRRSAALERSGTDRADLALRLRHRRRPTRARTRPARRPSRDRRARRSRLQRRRHSDRSVRGRGRAAAVAVLRCAASGWSRRRSCSSGRASVADLGTELAQRIGGTVAEGGCVLVLPDAMGCNPPALLAQLHESLGFVPVLGAVAAGAPMFELYNTDAACGRARRRRALRAAQPVIGVAQGCTPIGEPLRHHARRGERDPADRRTARRWRCWARRSARSRRRDARPARRASSPASRWIPPSRRSSAATSSCATWSAPISRAARWRSPSACGWARPCSSRSATPRRLADDLAAMLDERGGAPGRPAAGLRLLFRLRRPRARALRRPRSRRDADPRAARRLPADRILRQRRVRADRPPELLPRLHGRPRRDLPGA